MSDLRIGLVAEGKTDETIITAAITAFLGRSFVLTLIQPETSDAFGGAGALGGGWGGVYRWCRKMVSMRVPVGENPSLGSFDLIIIHVDADVAGMTYDEAKIHDGPAGLPCERPCPPAADSVNALRKVILHWLDLDPAGGPPERWVFCNPSKCPESWLVAALYRDRAPKILSKLECNPGLENWLSQRPIREGRLVRGKKKIVSEYKRAAKDITRDWSEVERHCTQAARFRKEVQGANRASS